MPNAAHVRAEIEFRLGTRAPAAFDARVRSELERIACDIAPVDALLHGGLPVGVLTELVGAESSGRTTVALAYVAAATRRGGVCAWIDVADTLDPESVAANGVDLERMLWVRCGAEAAKPHQGVPGSQKVASADKDLQRSSPVGGGWDHPRSEGKNMPEAIAAMMRPVTLPEVQARREKKKVGTPGAPNRPLSYRSEQREEELNSDRLPPRRGDNLTLVLPAAQQVARRVFSRPKNVAQGSAKPWQALDQALRAADLLLQGGGFSMIVLDLGSTPPEMAWRVPLATWFRFRGACERGRVSLLLLSQHPCARSSAELVVRLEPGSMEKQNGVLTGLRFAAVTERSRHAERVVPMRKPPQPSREGYEQPGQWLSRTTWAQTS